MAEGKESRAEIERVTLENFHLVAARTIMETIQQSPAFGYHELVTRPPTPLQVARRETYIEAWAEAQVLVAKQVKIISDLLLLGPNLFEPDKWPLEQTLAGTTIFNLDAVAAKIEEKQAEARTRAEAEKTNTQQSQTKTGNEQSQ